MKGQRKGRESVTKEICLEIASTCFNRNELQKKDCYVYKVMYKNGWLEEIFPSRFMRPEKYTYEELKEIAAKYESKNSFKWGDYNAYHRARTRPYFEEICSHMKTFSKCDNDVLYLYKTNLPDIYKVGITSLRLGKRRLMELKSHSGLDFEPVLIVNLSDAKSVEKEILKLGRCPDHFEFGGYKELRMLTQEEVNQIVDVMKASGGVLS